MRGLHGGRKFRNGDAVADRQGDVLGRGVVVAGERRAVLACKRDQCAVVFRAVEGGMLVPLFEHHVELDVGETAGLAAIIVAQLRLVAKLALPRRVIHQREQPHLGAADQRPRLVDHVGHRHLAAQVQEMIRPQHVGVARRRDGVGEQRRLAADFVGAFLAPDAQRIQNRRDAADGELAVIRNHRRYRVPMHLGTRHVVRFDVIGVKLDKAGDDEVACHVLGIAPAAGRGQIPKWRRPRRRSSRPR